MKRILFIISFLAATFVFTQEETPVADSVRTEIDFRMDTITQDSAMMSHAEIYDYYYYKKIKYPQCLSTVDTLVAQNNEKSLQIIDLKKNVETWEHKFNKSQKVVGEKDIQLHIEQARNNKKIWGIVGGTLGGLVTGFIIGWAIAK